VEYKKGEELAVPSALSRVHKEVKKSKYRSNMGRAIMEGKWNKLWKNTQERSIRCLRRVRQWRFLRKMKGLN